MDIEGAEEMALDGGKNTIILCKPILEISAYHKTDDIWKLPLKLKNWLPSHKLALRTYSEVDLVYYLIPQSRVALHLLRGMGGGDL